MKWSRKRWTYGDFAVFLLRAEKALGSSNVQNAVAEKLKVIVDVAKDLPSELKSKNAVAEKLKVIVDIAKDLPSEFTQKNAEVPWYKISEMIDQLGCKWVGFEPVQTTIFIMNELPALKKKIEKIHDKKRMLKRFYEGSVDTLLPKGRRFLLRRPMLAPAYRLQE